MAIRRRTLLGHIGGAAALGWSAGPAPAQTREPTVLRPPPLRLVVAGAERPIELRAMRIETEIAGRLALTTVELAFFNPNGRVLEGELQFPLLDGQAVVGMAMELDGAMREAVAVGKAQGEAVFEDVTRARIDPALLSQTLGNHYKLRVYPLLPNAGKRVAIRYAETLAARGGRLGWRLPLDVAVRPAELSVSIRVAGVRSAPRASADGIALPAFAPAANGHAFAWTLRDGAPPAAIAVDWPVDPQGSVAVGRHDGHSFFVAQLPVPADRAPRPLPRSVGLVWDASGSGAGRHHGREFALLDAYFARAGRTEVHLLRIRDAAEPAKRFQVDGGDWSALRRELESTVYDGASALGDIPASLGGAEWLLFSDGLANYGTRSFGPATVPLYAVSSSPRGDAQRLRALAEASGGAFIDLSALTPADAAARLLERPARLAGLASNGAKQLVAASTRADDGWLTVAGELTEAATTVQLAIEPARGAPRTVELRVEAGGAAARLAPQAWARLRIAALEADADTNRGEIRRLSQAFAVVTRETSLIVLDRAEDYARHDIAPPPELAAAVAQARARGAQQQRRVASAGLEQVVRSFERKVAWWQGRYPKDAPPAVAERDLSMSLRPLDALPRLERRAGAVPPSSLPAPALAASPMPSAEPARRMAKVAESSATADMPAPAVIRLRPLQADSPALRRLRAAAAGQLYRTYLDERASHLDSTAFFLDAAELLFERGEAALALRVLSNLAELELESRQVLRVLAQRLVQAGQPGLAVPLLRRVLALAPHEPQSHRDLGLALAADGRPQEGVEALREVVQRPWPRFPEIELIALAELNALAARHRGVDTSGIDPRLLRNLPLDLRIVLGWDSDDTDIDLWVTDPDGDAAHYARPLTRQGGRMSQDATGGYGPEEFGLRHAKPGTYRIEAQFFGHRRQVLANATTIQAVVCTGFGTPEASERRITLRLRDPKDRVFVGSVEVGPSAAQAVGSR